MAYLFCFHSLRRKEIKLCFFWLHDRSLPVSWDFGQWAIDEMMFCWSSSHFFHGLDWHFCQWWSLPLYFGKLVQNTFCKLPKCGWQGYQGLKQCTAIDDVCDMSLVWHDNMMTVTAVSKACITWDLSVFIGVPSLVASGHGTGPKG